MMCLPNLALISFYSGKELHVTVFFSPVQMHEPGTLSLGEDDVIFLDIEDERFQLLPGDLKNPPPHRPGSSPLVGYCILS